MRIHDRRQHPRQRENFQVVLRKYGLDFSIEGTTVNISQGGAFIKTKNWRSFKVDDQAVIAFYLPPKYTGQTKTIGLQGPVVISRVDHEQKGIGVKFIKYFRQFEPIIPSRAAGQD
ncbi:MAG: PilZ domain-containing protein [Deltaproteobacteria bacterium]|jgi:hypothetical protein